MYREYLEHREYIDLAPPRAIELLNECIEHWIRISNLTYDQVMLRQEPPNVEGCALCSRWESRHISSCTCCPIKEYTGQRVCGGTPYAKAADLYWDVYHQKRSTVRGLKTRALEEVRFLRKVKRSLEK
jgi:hypothetical protein